VVRTAVQALAAVLGGAQSLHTNALDEALALPTEDAALLALRTQQILAFETGLTDVVDPLGGSYCVERLTADLEAEALRQFEVIDTMGGMVPAIEAGYPQREIAESAYRDQQAVESKARTIIGVNAFVAEHEPLETLYIDEAAEQQQRAGLERLRRERDAGRVRGTLEALKGAAAAGDNTMPRLLDAVRAYATVGEMCDALREVWGEYTEVPII
jgi:methylmalonyl-CoA mutase N-terminal domain/subunit